MCVYMYLNIYFMFSGMFRMELFEKRERSYFQEVNKNFNKQQF